MFSTIYPLVISNFYSILYALKKKRKKERVISIININYK